MSWMRSCSQTIGGLDKLVFHEDWPVPSPSPSQLLLKLHACGPNNTDVVGTVVAAGDSADAGLIGQRVMADC